MNSIILHNGSYEVSYDDLQTVRTPEASPTWTPIPHTELLDAVRSEVLGSGLVIQREMLALSNARTGLYGDRFFGLLEIAGDDGVYSLTIAVRNSHAKEFPAGLCVGSKVLVCDNLAFSAEVVIARKHTRFIRRDLPSLINGAVGRLGDLRDHQTKRIEAYQNTTISDPQFHDLLVRGVDGRVICASKLPQVLDAYRHPEHEEFRPRTVWSGFNAFTEVLKSYELQDLPKRTQALHGLCDMASHLS